jgi:hypothetical protein
MDHPDFRVRGKIFATLLPDRRRGVVMLCPEDQLKYVRESPSAFTPAAGAWGRRGCTEVLLEAVRARTLKEAIQDAWSHKAPSAADTGLKDRSLPRKPAGRPGSLIRKGRNREGSS